MQHFSTVKEYQEAGLAKATPGKLKVLEFTCSAAVADHIGINVGQFKTNKEGNFMCVYLEVMTDDYVSKQGKGTAYPKGTVWVVPQK